MAENAVNTEQGVILEALNNKVDLNQLNTNNQGLSYVSGLGMPSGKYIDLELGASGSTYTAPANGWVSLSAGSSSSGYVGMDNSTSRLGSGNRGPWQIVTIPCKKGDIIHLGYDNNIINFVYFRFIYAQGESEE